MKDCRRDPYEPCTRHKPVRTDEASGDADALAQRGRLPDLNPPLCRGFCYVRSYVKKCSQVDSHTGYV
jgi:hypothetical protein